MDEKLLHLQTFQQNQILIKRKGTCASPAQLLLIRFFLFLEALQVRLLGILLQVSIFFRIFQKTKTHKDTDNFLVTNP
jgi:hypothetical protein